MKRFGCALLLMLIALMVGPANASMIVNIGGVVSGGVLVGGVNYTDNQAGVDVNPAIGILDLGVFLNSIAVNFRILGFAATSGSPIASMTMNGNANVLPAVALPFSVNINISDTDFTIPSTPLIMAQTVNLLSSTGGLTANAIAIGYYGDSNTNFDVNGASTAAATSNLAAGIGTNVPGFSGPIIGPVPYSLTTAIHVDVLARGTDPIQNLQLNANLAAVGAPTVPELPPYLYISSVLILGRWFGKKLARKPSIRPDEPDSAEA